MTRSSGFGKIIGTDRLDAKSVTPISEANRVMEENRPAIDPRFPNAFGGRSGFKQHWLDMRWEKWREMVQNSVRKRTKKT